MKAVLFGILGLGVGIVAGIDVDRQVWPEVAPVTMYGGSSMKGPIRIANRFGCEVSFAEAGGIWPDASAPSNADIVLCSGGAVFVMREH